METTRHWGLFVNEHLVSRYAFTPFGYEEALEDAAFAFQESGIPHEIKQFSVGQTKS